MRWVLSTYNLTDFSSFDVSDGSGPLLELIILNIELNISNAIRTSTGSQWATCSQEIAPLLPGINLCHTASFSFQCLPITIIMPIWTTRCS